MKKNVLFILLLIASIPSFSQIGSYYNGQVGLRQDPAYPILWGGQNYNNQTYKIKFGYSSNTNQFNTSKLVFSKVKNGSISNVVSNYPYTNYSDSVVFVINSFANQFLDSISITVSSIQYGMNADIITKATLYLDSANSNNFLKLAKDTLLQYYEGGFNLASPGIPKLVNADTITNNVKNWYRSFGGSKADSTTGVAVLNDSTSIFIGNSTSQNNDLNTVTDTSSSFVVKYDKDGGMIWKTILTGDKLDRVLYTRGLANGDILVLGEATSVAGAFSGNHGMKDLWLIKLAANGSLLWQKLLGGAKDETAAGLRLSKSNDIYIAAHTNSNNGDIAGLPGTDTNGHLWLLKLDATGAIINQKVVKDSGDIYNYTAFEILDNGQLIVVAASKTFYAVANESIENAYTIKLDSNFNYLSLDAVSRGVLYNTRINAITKSKNDGYGLIGTAWGTHYYADPYAPYYSMQAGQKDMVFYAVGNGVQTTRIFYGGLLDDEGLDIAAVNDTFYLAGKTCGSPTSSIFPEIIGYHLPADGVKRSDGWILKLQGGSTGNIYDVITQKTFGGNGNDEVARLAINKDKSLLIAGNTDTYNNGDVYDSKGGTDAFLVKYSSPNIVTGKVFIDANNNNLYDVGEVLYNASTVKTESGTTSGVSNIVQGKYYNQVDTGKFITKPILANSYYTSVPLADTVTFQKFLQTRTVNFALHPIAGIKDIKVSLLPISNARPGSEADYQVIVENTGTTVIPVADLKIIKDSRTSLLSATLPQSSSTADSINWSINNFKPLDVVSFYLALKLNTPPSVNNGDTIKLSAIISPVAGDSTPLNNTNILLQVVKSAVDPNDKAENHLGKLNTQQLTAGDYLTYTIRFQNTGNDTAFKVSVRDTLDAKLDWSSLQMLSASHAYTMVVNNGNKIEWKFDPIFLPDSNINEPASHGYVAFRIKPKANVADGDIIKNNAAIYFDFNLPVITNTVQTLYGTPIPVVPPSITVVSLTATQSSGNIIVNWQTVNEVGIQKFEVEKSRNGVVFSLMETTVAKGVGAIASNYSATDPLPDTGYNYYRLKIIDKNGQYTYSQVVRVNIVPPVAAIGVNLIMKPNPVNDKTTIVITGEINGKLQVNLMYINGSIVKEIFSGNVSTSSFSIPLNVTNFAKAVYLIEVITENKRIVKKLVVQ